MGVRVVIEIRRDNAVVRTAALANSGYEADEPEIHIPLALAKKLFFRLEALKSERYRVVGAEISAYILGYVDVRLALEDRETEWVRSKAVSAPGEYEVLLSDALIERLGVEIIGARTGTWRLRGDDRVRRSVEPEYWVD